MDRMTRKTLMMYGAFHLNSDIDRLYLKQKHGGRGLISVEMSVRSKENNLGLHVHRSSEMLLKGIKKLLLSKLKILWKKKTSRKTAKMSLKINGKKRGCMNSLFVKCLKKQVKTYLRNGWCRVFSKCKLKQRYVLHKNKY